MIRLYGKEKIAEWKKIHWAVYSVEVGNVEFVYRQLSRKEQRIIVSTYQNIEEQEDAICETCVLWPENFNYSSGPAGTPTTLAEMILTSSGFGDESIDAVVQTITKYREEMENIDNQLSCIITEAFPQFSIDEIEDWPLDKSLWYLSRAEYVINELRAMIANGGTITYASSEPEEEVFEQTIPTQRRPSIIDDPAFDRTLLNPELAKNKKPEVRGSKSDFPELSEIDRFMKGEWRPE